MKISKVIFHIKPIPSHPWWECKKAPTEKCCAPAILSWMTLKKIFSVLHYWHYKSHFTEFRLISLFCQKKIPEICLFFRALQWLNPLTQIQSCISLEVTTYISSKWSIASLNNACVIKTERRLVYNVYKKIQVYDITTDNVHSLLSTAMLITYQSFQHTEN